MRLAGDARHELDGEPGPWGTPGGFNMRWTTLPQQLAAPPGLVRWSPVDGATSYQVWYLDAGMIFQTQTTVADEREYYTFHQGANWTQRSTGASVPSAISTAVS